MIEEMKEFSGIGETRRTLQYVTLFVIALFWVYEGYRTFALYLLYFLYHIDYFINSEIIILPFL